MIARRQHLVAQGRAPAGAGARIATSRAPPMLCTYVCAGAGVHGERALGVARGQHVLPRAGGERLVHHRAREDDPLAGGRAAAREQQVPRRGRLDAHARPLQEGERREVHRLDGFVGPEYAEVRHGVSLQMVVVCAAPLTRPPCPAAAAAGRRSRRRRPRPRPRRRPTPRPWRPRRRAARRAADAATGTSSAAGSRTAPRLRTGAITYPAQRSVRNACRFTSYQSTMEGSSR